MLFKNFARNLKAKVADFAGNKLPGAISRGAQFFTNKVVPAIHLGHRLIKHAQNEINSSDLIEPKHKKTVSRIGEFADIGVKRLADAAVHVDTIEKKYGRRGAANSPDPPLAPV